MVPSPPPPPLGMYLSMTHLNQQLRLRKDFVGLLIITVCEMVPCSFVDRYWNPFAGGRNKGGGGGSKWHSCACRRSR